MKEPIRPSRARPNPLTRFQPAAVNQPRTEAQEAQAILIALMMPVLMTILNQSMFGVALPTVRDYFQVQADTAAWIVTVYSLPFMMLMPFYGRLGDGLGKRRLLLGGVAIFLVGTSITLWADNLGWLMVGRAIQGAGAAGMVPLGMAIISGIFPANQRGQALGTWNSIGPITGIIAPLTAGFLIDNFDWRVIFWPPLAVGAVALLVVKLQVPSGIGRPRPRFLRTFDWGGVLLLSGALTCLLFYLSSRPITGVDPLRDWRLLLVTLFLFAGFILWERQRNNPFISLHIFNHSTFTLASFCGGVRMFTMSSLGFLIPLYLVDVHETSAVFTGTVLMIHAGALLVTIRLGGQVADRWGSRWPVVGGLITQVLTMLMLAGLPSETSLVVVIIVLVLHGLGAGLVLAALHRSAMGGVPEDDMGMAAGLYSMIRFAGSAIGIALVGVVLQNGLDRALSFGQAYQIVFLFVAGVTVLGVLVGFWLRE